MDVPRSPQDTTYCRNTSSGISHRPGSLPLRSTGLPSPCGRLSRPRTTTGAPSPWGFPPLGDPAFRVGMTFRTVAGALFVTLRLATPTLSPGACLVSECPTLTILGTRDVNHRSPA